MSSYMNIVKNDNNNNNKIKGCNRKGWIIYKKDGRVIDTTTEEQNIKIENDYKTIKQTQFTEDLMNRVIKYKIQNLINENYNEEEIQDLIEEFIYNLDNNNEWEELDDNASNSDYSDYDTE